MSFRLSRNQEAGLLALRHQHKTGRFVYISAGGVWWHWDGQYINEHLLAGEGTHLRRPTMLSLVKRGWAQQKTAYMFSITDTGGSWPTNCTSAATPSPHPNRTNNHAKERT